MTHDGEAPEFEQKLHNSFNNVISRLDDTRENVLIKLDTVQESLINSMPVLVAGQVGTLIKDALNEVSAIAQSTVQDSKSLNQVQTLQDELRTASENYSSLKDSKIRQDREISLLNDALATQEREIAVLNEAVVSKDREISLLRTDIQDKKVKMGKLHGIIVKQGQREEAFNDEDLAKDFAALSHDIMRVVNTHFLNRYPRAKTPGLIGMTRADAALFCRSRIATHLFRSFFSPSVRIYGLNSKGELAQRDLEIKFREYEVPEANIIDWRVALLKATMKLNMEGKHDEATIKSHRLFRELQADYDVVDERTAQKEMKRLCTDAWNLALLLRSSKIVYQWHQIELVDQFPEDDIELIGPFNLRNKDSQPKPVLTLFGPLYKKLDGSKICVRKGDVLNGDW